MKGQGMIQKLPTGWQINKLNDVIVDIIDYRGKTPKKLGGNWSKSGIIALSAMNVKQGRLVKIEKAKFVNEELYYKWMKSEVVKSDILMTSEVPLGETYLVPDNKRICLSQRLFCIRANPNIILPEFLFYFFNAPTSRRQIDLKATGTTVLGIRQPDLRQLSIIVPPLPTQRKIAAILSAYDDLIENNTRRIKILENMAQTLYQEWFVHFRFPGHENVPMVESPLGPIPQGWEIGEFEDIVENLKEKVKPGKHLNSLPYVPIDCIPRHSVSLMEHKPSSEAKSSLIAFKQNDILFGAMRSYFHKVILAPFDGITRQTCFVLRSKNSDNYPFDLFTAFQDSTVQYSSNRSTGSTIPYATWERALAMMPIFMPPNLLIKRFCDVVVPMLDSIHAMLKKNTNLRQTRDLLLPKLISGEIDVSDIDIDTDGMPPSVVINHGFSLA